MLSFLPHFPLISLTETSTHMHPSNSPLHAYVLMQTQKHTRISQRICGNTLQVWAVVWLDLVVLL